MLEYAARRPTALRGVPYRARIRAAQRGVLVLVLGPHPSDRQGVGEPGGVGEQLAGRGVAVPRVRPVARQDLADGGVEVEHAVGVQPHGGRGRGDLGHREPGVLVIDARGRGVRRGRRTRRHRRRARPRGRPPRPTSPGILRPWRSLAAAWTEGLVDVLPGPGAAGRRAGGDGLHDTTLSSGCSCGRIRRRRRAPVTTDDDGEQPGQLPTVAVDEPGHDPFVVVAAVEHRVQSRATARMLPRSPRRHDAQHQPHQGADDQQRDQRAEQRADGEVPDEVERQVDQGERHGRQQCCPDEAVALLAAGSGRSPPSRSPPTMLIRTRLTNRPITWAVTKGTTSIGVRGVAEREGEPQGQRPAGRQEERPTSRSPIRHWTIRPAQGPEARPCLHRPRSPTRQPGAERANTSSADAIRSVSTPATTRHPAVGDDAVVGEDRQRTSPGSPTRTPGARKAPDRVAGGPPPEAGRAGARSSDCARSGRRDARPVTGVDC